MEPICPRVARPGQCLRVPTEEHVEKNHLEFSFLLSRIVFARNGRYCRPISSGRPIGGALQGPLCWSRTGLYRRFYHLVTREESSLSAEVIMRGTARFWMDRILAVAAFGVFLSAGQHVRADIML